MARSPAPPGPPPPHYRPPGAVGPTGSPVRGAGSLRLGSAPAAHPPPDGGIGPLAATGVAVGTLLLGLVVGFFLGRGFDDDGAAALPEPTVRIEPTPTTTPPPGDTIPQAPPGGSPRDPATSAPPATDLAPATIGAFDDPVPVGQAYILGLYEITVVGATRDATPVLSDHDPTNPPPPTGDRHVLVELEVRFTDATGLGNPGAIPFFVDDGTARWFSYDATCGRVPDDLADAGLLEAGEVARGQVCFTVPDDAVADLRFATEGFAGPLYFALPA